MPFTTPWRDYAVGDLVYGLAGPRWDLIQYFQQNFGMPHNEFCTIDQFDIASVDRQFAGLRYDQNFVQALQAHAKYDDVVFWGDAGIDLRDDIQWNQDPNFMGAIAKRKCKGGLDWATRQTQRHIHFCLEGLNLIAAASKSYDGAAGGVADNPVGKAPANVGAYIKARSITGAELRWVYRNKRDGRVQAQIQFWRRQVSWGAGGAARQNVGWSQCGPPWSMSGGMSAAVRQAWAAYHPANPF